jgi:hypothetical protein
LRIEYIPVAIGVIVIALGLAVMWDAWGPQSLGPMRDRRRRSRAALNTPGELIAGIGFVLLGAALIGRDWRLETVSVLLGTICVLIGALKNWKYFREMFLFRGAARRNTDTESHKRVKMRIR